MKVLFDHQIFSWQRFGGISRYFCEMYSHFGDDVEVLNSTIFTDNQHLKEYSKKFNSFLTKHRFKGKALIQSRVNLFNSNRLLLEDRFDIFHPTYYDTYYLDTIKDKPIVLTVHDMTHELFADFVNDDNTTRDKQITINKASKIIAVSNQTKNDIIKVFDVNPNKIEVIYHGINQERRKIRNKIGYKFKYLLYVGERLQYKNFENLVRSFKNILNDYPDLFLVCTGKSFNDIEVELISKLGILKNVKHIFVTEDELIELYSYAEMLVYPSFSEGFGIPILEAMKYNCPVVLSNIECFNEVAGDAGFFFDPYSVDSITYSITEILVSNSLKDELISKGEMRVKEFTWNKTAEKTTTLYKSII